METGTSKNSYKISILSFILKSILAGMCISIGCICYLSVDNKMIGSLLFSVGLYSILAYKLYLFTGKIGFSKSINNVLCCICILIFNCLGCILIYKLIQLTPIIDKINAQMQIIANNKIQTPLNQLFIQGIICGILMLFATKDTTQYIFLPMLCISVFILIGAEHSVADAFYLLGCNNLLIYIKSIMTIVLGNATGAIITNRIIEL